MDDLKERMEMFRRRCAAEILGGETVDETIACLRDIPTPVLKLFQRKLDDNADLDGVPPEGDVRRSLGKLCRLEIGWRCGMAPRPEKLILPALSEAELLLSAHACLDSAALVPDRQLSLLFVLIARRLQEDADLIRNSRTASAAAPN